LKRRDLLKVLKILGCELKRHGSNHDWYFNPKSGVYQPVPRHSEINENLAKSIIKKMSK
jgi:mRNA interferase HicA